MTDLNITEVEQYYSDRVSIYGATPLGVDWRDVDSQKTRFRELLRLIDDEHDVVRINDFGCGYGALLDTLDRKYPDCRYLGYDVSAAMIACARERYADHVHAAFTNELAEVPVAEFTLASGVFNVRLDTPAVDWERYVYESLDELVRLSKAGVAFNMLTAHADPDKMRPDLFYADPARILDHCLTHYSRDVVVRHDYGLYEFTVSVRLDRRKPVKRALGLIE